MTMLTTTRRQTSSALFFAKFFYFFYFSAIGILAPFLNIYLKQIGLTGSQIGLLGSFPPLLVLLANPFWGAIADRWKAQRLVLILGALVGALVSPLFLWTNNFWLLSLLLLVLVFFRNPLGSIVDSVVVNQVVREGSSYGRQRLWGSLGFILCSFGLAQVIRLDQLSWIFWLHAAALLGCAFFGFMLPVEKGGERVNLLHGLKALLRQRSYSTFLFAIVLLGTASALTINFLGLYILALGGKESQVGMAYAANAIGEIPVMYFGATVAARIASRKLIAGSLLGFAMVWTVIGTTTSPTVLIATTSLIGICFGMSWIAAVDYANHSAPAGLRATAQTLVGAAHGGLGWSIGSLIGGELWDLAGGSILYFVAALTAILAASIFWWGSKPENN